MRRPWTLLVAVALLAAALPSAALAATPSTAAAPSIGGFSVRPAEFDPADPATRAYFKLQIPAGGTSSDRVVVGDGGPAPVTLRVYAADGLTGVTSGAVYSNRTDPLHAAGRWLTPAGSTITLAPHSSRAIGFRVAVPAGTTPGVHLAGIAFEDAKPPATGGRFAITEVFRVVVGVEIRVPGPASSAVALTGAAIHALGGTGLPAVLVGVANRGGLLCRPDLTVALTPVSGTARAETESRRLDTILPGDTIAFPLPWRVSLAAGSYHVAARATGCGHPASLVSVASIDHRLRTPSSPSPSPSARPRPVVHDIMPWWVLALVAAAAGVGGMGLGVFARRSRRRVSL